jgi:transcriptional regulator with XRE-family HTH domain
MERVPGDNVEQKAKLLGTTNPTLYSYLRGRTSPSVDFLTNLKIKAGIDLNWLLTGEESGSEAKNKKAEVKSLINQKLFVIINSKLERYLKRHATFLKQFDLSFAMRVMYVVQIYNYIVEDVENMTKGRLNRSIDKTIKLIFGVQTISYRVDPSYFEHDYDSLDDEDVVDFATENDIIIPFEEGAEAVPDGEDRYTEVDQLIDMADSINDYLDSLLKDIPDKELTRERVKGILQAVLEHFETERQKSA